MVTCCKSPVSDTIVRLVLLGTDAISPPMFILRTSPESINFSLSAEIKSPTPLCPQVFV